MLLEVCLIVYILYASMLLLTTPDKLNNWILVILLTSFILLILFVSFFIKEGQVEVKEEVNSKVNSKQQVNNHLNQQEEVNEMENYLCNYSDNPQCYNKDSKSCDGYGIQGRPFEFEYTPQTDINWNWVR